MDQAFTRCWALLDGDAQRGDSAASLAALPGWVPVAVIWGSADRVIPAAQAEAVKGAARHLIDGAGHMPHMEHPAEIQAAIEDNMAAQPRRRPAQTPANPQGRPGPARPRPAARLRRNVNSQALLPSASRQGVPARHIRPGAARRERS